MNTYQKSVDFGTTDDLLNKFKRSGFEIQSFHNIASDRNHENEGKQRSNSPRD